MDWAQVLKQLFELVIYPVLGVTGIYLTYLIKVKINELKQKTDKVETGIFGEYMQVSLVNDGPATFLLEKEYLEKSDFGSNILAELK